MLLVVSGRVAAQQQPSAASMMRSLSHCREVAPADAKLACFEKATTDLEAAIQSKEVTIVDRQEIRQARRSLFGFSVPHIPLFGGGDRDSNADKSSEFAEINTTITSARTVANGRVELKLAEADAVWQTTDPLVFPPKPGAKVRIRQGALGNYFIAIQGERSVRGYRIR